ncbi:MAG TPA: glycerophosphodiester phosphodiesterase [Candidatus Acetothermia bacterium]|nr:glycerophosphodiester phosphodiesterase [Candidatus Acetothermia bacterium]
MGRPLVIGHRGARSVAPENTLAAARAAAELGADGWEFDVQRTKDGALVLMHDEVLTRTTNAREAFPDRSPWRVSDFTLEEIQGLDAGSWFVQTDPFGTIASGEVPPARAEAFRGERVPTLREALLLSQELGLWVNIELKGAPLASVTPARRATVEDVAALVRELAMVDRVLVSSFDHEMIRRLKAIAPEVRGALLTVALPADTLSYLVRTGADAVNPQHTAYTAEWGRKLGSAGYGVYVWTVNEPGDLGRLAQDPSVTGIITDWPQRLRALLRDRG